MDYVQGTLQLHHRRAHAIQAASDAASVFLSFGFSSVISLLGLRLKDAH